MLKSRIGTHMDIHMEKLKRVLDNADIEVLVGFPSGLTHIETVHGFTEDGKRTTSTKQGGDLAELAEKLHFGAARIPARPFLEDGLSENREKLRKLMAKELERLKATGKANLDVIGVEAVGGIAALVRSGYYKEREPNAEMTIQLKGSDTPLIDGANMINSLHYAKVQNGKVMGMEKTGGQA